MDERESQEFTLEDIMKEFGGEAEQEVPVTDQTIVMEPLGDDTIVMEPVAEESEMEEAMTEDTLVMEPLGADTIVIHAGSASKISREEAVELAKDTMYHALETLPNTKVRFGLETMGKINQLGTLEEVIEICKIDPRLCPVVDFGHLNARNLGNHFVTEDDYARVYEAISKGLGGEYAENLHCHFSKIEYSAGGEKKHLTFEDTVFGPPFEPLMNTLQRLGVNSRIICESDGTQAEDSLAMKQYYSSLQNK